MADENQYKVIYNIMNGYGEWWILLLCLCPIALGFLAFQTSKLTENFMPRMTQLNITLGMAPNDFRLMVVFVSALLLLIVGGFFVSTYTSYWESYSIMSSGEAQYVEGTVDNFSPMPINGRGAEAFTVNGVPFHYKDSILSPGFHTTSLHGSPIHEGLPVRIWFHGNDILKLEIKD